MSEPRLASAEERELTTQSTESGIRHLVDRFSVPSAVFAVVALAMAFDLGFFWDVGISFISLFSLQEHIVFSMIGALVIAVIYFFATPALQRILGERILGEQPPPHFTFRRGVVWFLVAVSLIYASYLMNAANGFAVAVQFFLAANCVLGTILAIRWYAWTRSILLITAGALFSAVLVGAFWGDFCVFSTFNHSRAWAVVNGTHYGLVRVGAQFTLLASDDFVVYAVPTSSITEMGYRHFLKVPAP